MKFFLRVSLFIFLGFFWATAGLNAQQVGIFDKDTGEPISDVAVFTQDRSVTALTDFDGQFDLGIFPEGVRIEIRHLAYQTRTLFPEGVRQMGGRILLVSRPEQLQEIVISISKWEQQKRDIPQKIETISAAAVALGNPQTSADLLQQSGKVFVQKSQYGGGSPMIRGFATNRVLLAVDGVRMNNAIFRGGNIQNIISVDPFTVQNVEVLFGPGSVIYGSDAIGGVMNFYTKSPRFARADSLEFEVNAGYRTSSASNEQTLHGDFTLSGEKWASLTSLTYNAFGDLKMGMHGPESYLRPGYVVTRNGQDEFQVNSDPRKQVPTGYHQWSFMQKVGYRPDNSWSFDLGLHYSQTSDVPRYDRLIRPAENEAGLQSAEWEYGPQTWGMGNLLVSHKGSDTFYDRVKLSAAYQYFEESRRDRNFQDPIRFKTKEQVDAYSLNLDFENGKIGNFNLYYGAEFVLNQVDSEGSQENILTGQQLPASSRYPDDSLWMSLAAYVNSTYRIKPNLTLLAGLRYSHFWIDADFVQDFYPFPFEEADLDNGAITGSLGVSWFPHEDTQLTANIGTGFRAPNIDDIGKVFDSEPGAVVVPNPDLEPEYAYNFEVGIRQNLGDKLVVRGSAYYTLLTNAMVRRDYTFNETDTIVYNGVPSKVQALQNASRAFVYGVELGFDATLHEYWDLRGNLTFAEGEEEESDGRTTAARHVAPTFGNLELAWDKYPWQAGVFLNYNGEIPFEDLALSERAKPFMYAEDSNGNPFSPSWYTLNLRASYTLWDRYQFTFAIENLTNQRYRTYSSGIAAAGFNVIAGFNVQI